MLTRDEAAAALRVTPRTVSEWIKSGKLKAVKPGRRVLIPREEIDRLLRGA